MDAAALLGVVIAGVRDAGLTVVDDLDGRPGGAPPDQSASVSLDRPFDLDGALLDTRRVQAALRVRMRLRLRRGQAWAELRAAELAHRLCITLPELPLGGTGVGGPVIAPPGGRRLSDDAITARMRMRLLTGAPQHGLQHQAGALEALRAVAHEVMRPRPGVDQVTLPSSLELRAVGQDLGVLEADLVLTLDPLIESALRPAHAAIIAGMRAAGRRVDDDGSGRVVDLLEQRDPRAADVRLVSYAGFTLSRVDDAIDLEATFPVVL